MLCTHSYSNKSFCPWCGTVEDQLRDELRVKEEENRELKKQLAAHGKGVMDTET